MKAIHVTAIFILLSVIAVGPNAVAQESTPQAVAVIDVTSWSDCSIVSRTYASMDIESEVIDERQTACPPGTVIQVTPVEGEAAARALGGLFVPLSGTVDADFKAIQSAKQQLLPTGTWSYGLEQQSALGCSDRSFSKSLQYRAYQPAVTVYSTVYYWQDYTCDTGVSSAKASLSWDANLWWRQMVYSPPYWFEYHGCPNLSTGASWDTYNKRISLGGTYQDESINEGGTTGCRYGSGES